MTEKEILASFATGGTALGVLDFVGVDTPTDDIPDVVAAGLDDCCSNGRFSRWTAHGSWIYANAMGLVGALKSAGL